ncbi:methyltransferase domain-containing protein [Methylobacterium oryzae]|uniref:methyltransferase domain-containing protein n=1 Tax=Methylobacterium oryzae TaxID=334852 RepID=UPI001F2508F3|nr:glycosyltransferase family 2 protein [Methylobacterium oryzae]UIN32910.1 glycosyltransferase family 2 protein [Methylobacterium oryzae]
MQNSDLFLPSWYERRVAVDYYDDRIGENLLLRHQPEIYGFAEYLSRKDGRSTIIDLGCGTGNKIKSNVYSKIIGVDQGVNLDAFKRRHKTARAVEGDLEVCDFPWPADLAWNEVVVVCADVIEHLIDPTCLLAELAKLTNAGAVVLLSSPDRDRVYGGQNVSPPANPCHVQEWTLKELCQLIKSSDVPVSFSGYTISDNMIRRKATSLIISDGRAVPEAFGPETVGQERPVAIIAAYNDEDVIYQVCQHYIKNDVDLHLIDNWSEDDTYVLMRNILKQYPGRVKLERFPVEGPAEEYRWVEILNRKAAIAAAYEGRWVLHIDSDEIRVSPWHDLSLRAALEYIESHGFNCIDHCVINFKPTKNGFDQHKNLNLHFRHFEFGRHPAHFLQRRGWIQPKDIINLSNSGGHFADFDGARQYPYRFPLFHYPIRSQKHGEQKIFRDRQLRYSRSEQAERGWHNHYDSILRSEVFIALPELLEKFTEEGFYENFIVEILSDVVLQRRNGSLVAAD